MTLHLTSSQIAAFDAMSQQAFEQRMVTYLRDNFNARFESAGQDLVLSGVRAAQTKAGRYGIVHDDDVRRFLGLLAVHGGHCDNDPRLPWIADILGAGHLSATQKLDRLDEHELNLFRQEALP